MRRLRTGWLLFAVLVVGSGCGGARPDAASDREEPESDTDVVVQVISHTFNVVDVYLYRGSARRLLGTASGHSVTVFRVPWRHLEGRSYFALTARIIGDARTATSGTLRVEPGSLVTWTLENELARTHVVVHQ